MKRFVSILVASLGVVFACVAQNDSIPEDSTGGSVSPGKKDIQFGLFSNSFLQVDLKAIDPRKGQFGIDYHLDLKRALNKNPIKGARFKYYDLIADSVKEERTLNYINLTLASRGFVTVADDLNPVNSLISELKVDGFPLLEFGRKKTPVNPSDFKLATTFEDTELVDGTEDDVQKEVNQILAKVSSPFYVYANVHVKHETTQDFKFYDIALGASVSISSAFLSKLLDYPFYVLRNSAAGNNAVQAFVHVGYDYVTAVKNTALGELRSGTNSVNRLNVKGEWQTGIFTPRTRIGFLYDAYYEINPAQAIKDNNLAFNRFFVVRLDHYLNSPTLADLIAPSASGSNLNRNPKTVTKVSVKYTQGQLPPNFTTGFVLGGGFSIDF